MKNNPKLPTLYELGINEKDFNFDWELVDEGDVYGANVFITWNNLKAKETMAKHLQKWNLSIGEYFQKVHFPHSRRINNVGIRTSDFFKS